MQFLSETFIKLNKRARDLIVFIRKSYVRYPLFLSDVMEREFSRQIFENTQISDLLKIHPVAAELFHADGWRDGRTYMTKLIVAFRNFANASKKRCLRKN